METFLGDNQPVYVPIGKGRVNLHTGQKGGYYLPAWGYKDEPKEIPIVPPNKLRDIVLQLKHEIVGWRTKHAQTLSEMDKLKAKANRNTYTIK